MSIFLAVLEGIAVTLAALAALALVAAALVVGLDLTDRPVGAHERSRIARLHAWSGRQIQTRTGEEMR